MPLMDGDPPTLVLGMVMENFLEDVASELLCKPVMKNSMSYKFLAKSISQNRPICPDLPSLIEVS